MIHRAWSVTRVSTEELLSQGANVRLSVPGGHPREPGTMRGHWLGSYVSNSNALGSRCRRAVRLLPAQSLHKSTRNTYPWPSGLTVHTTYTQHISALARISHRRAWPDSGAVHNYPGYEFHTYPYSPQVTDVRFPALIPADPFAGNAHLWTLQHPGQRPSLCINADPPVPVLLTPHRGGQV